jgi:hypothetical protein
MGIFRRRKREPAPVSTPDNDLERYFTDCEQARARFDDLLTAAALSRNIVVIHGIGAVGKSSLLRMYRLACRRQSVPVGLVEAQDAPAAMDVLMRWNADLSQAGVSLPHVTDSVERYRKLQATAEREAAKSTGDQGTGAEFVGALAKGAVKVAANAVPLGGAVVEVSTDITGALVNLLRAKMSRADFEFLLEPADRVTDDLLADLAVIAARQRLVLMLDTLDQARGLSEWLSELAQRLPRNVILVLAGRVLPAWDRTWEGWFAHAERIELVEMSDADIEQLVRRYYGLIADGEPGPEQVGAVVRFARGLPLAATTAVRLGLYQLPGLEPVGPTAIADLADRLLEGIPPEMRPAFEAAAMLRSFDADSLQALLGDAARKDLYDELRRWPFTRARGERLAVHDTMREVMNDALRVRSPAEFRSLSERAAAYYSGLADRATGDDLERLQREWLYHSVRADEAAGMALFQQMAENLVRNHLVGRLRALLSEVATYNLRQEGSRLWRRYYGARLDELEGRTAAAEPEYAALTDAADADTKLRAYAWSDLSSILSSLDRLAGPGGEARATAAVEHSFQLEPELDAKLVGNYTTLARMSDARAAWSESLTHIGGLRRYAAQHDDLAGTVLADRLQAAVHGLEGDWAGYLGARRRCTEGLARLRDTPVLEMHVAYFTWPLVFMGRYREAQQSAENALALAVRLEERELMVTILESIGLALGMQGDTEAARQRFVEAQNFYDNSQGELPGAELGNPHRYLRAMLSFRARVALRSGRLQEAGADLDRALAIKMEIDDRIGLPELRVWRGEWYELQAQWDEAEAEYLAALEPPLVHRHNLECGASLGLLRVRCQRDGPHGGDADLLGARSLAVRYGYDDALAITNLYEGHRSWEAADGGFDAALACYHEAAVHALRFNRFLLDDLVSGTAPGSPLVSIGAACRQREGDGRRMLQALRASWTSGSNQTTAPAAANISPLPHGLPLVDAEMWARAAETGRGEQQHTLVEQLEAILQDLGT